MTNQERQPERLLTTILFTDIVGSTDLAAEVGDRQWRRVVAAHHVTVRRVLRRFGGREIDTAGDGFFASFGQPAQAVRAADAILSAVAKLGLSLRAGVHTGEAETTGRKIGGIAVHIAARVVAAAEPGEVLVSSTVRDLVSGSGLEFTDRGNHALKGVPTEWHLYGLVRPEAAKEMVSPAEAAAAIAAASSRAEGARGGRRTWLLLGVAGMAAVAIVVAAAAALGVFNAPPRGPSMPPGPDTLVALSASTGEVLDVRSVPAGPVSLAANADRLWVAALDAGVLLDLPTSATGTDRLIGRVGRPTGVAFGGGHVWVADAFGQTVTLVDPATGNVSRTLERLPARQIAYGTESAWAVDDLADRILRLDRQTGDVVATIPLGTGTYPTALAIGSAVWVGNQGTSTVARIDPATNSVVEAAIPLRAIPEAIAAGTADVWIISRASDVMMRLDPASNAVAATTPICDQPASVAADGDTVWIGCAGTRDVSHFAHDGTLLGTTAVGGEPTAITVLADRVYVTVRQP